MTRKFISATAILIATACGQPPPPVAPAGAEKLLPLLAAYRDATGGVAWQHVPAIESHASAALGGMSGTADTLEDVATGRNVSSIHLGALEQTNGFDGTSSWEHAPGGEVTVVDTPQARALALTTAWLARRGFFHANGVRYRDLGARDALGKHYRALEATPVGGTAVELWFDDHGMMTRTRYQSGNETITTDFADYRLVDNVRIPFHITIDDGDPRNRLTMTIQAVHVRAAPSASEFAAPHVDLDRIAFAGNAQHTQVPFELVNNHIYIHASVDGTPMRMLVDTGGLNMLTPAAAKRLDLTVDGALAGTGAGDDKVDVGIAHGKTLTVGDVSLAKPVFYVIDIGKLADVEGEDFDGLVGFELFSRLRVRIDYPTGVLTLMSPASFAPPAGAVAVPFEMNDRTPIVSGAIDGIPGRFEVDTGSRVSLTTMAKFTHDHDLAAKYHPAFETVTGWGVGGAARSAPVRFHEVKIGAAVVHDVVGDLFTGDKGALANPDAAANLGGGILHRFVVTFDYAAKIMYLEAGKDVDRRESYDRSGLFLLRDGDALRVVSVVPHSPAAAAGIREDDRITAFDGAPVTSKSLATWRDLLRERAIGTAVTLRVERHDAPSRAVAITLAELVP